MYLPLFISKKYDNVLELSCNTTKFIIILILLCYVVFVKKKVIVAILEDDMIIIEVLVSDDDMGSVIGRGGAIANAIRTIVQASSYVNGNKKVKINIDSF